MNDFVYPHTKYKQPWLKKNVFFWKERVWRFWTASSGGQDLRRFYPFMGFVWARDNICSGLHPPECFFFVGFCGFVPLGLRREALSARVPTIQKLEFRYGGKIQVFSCGGRFSWVGVLQSSPSRVVALVLFGLLVDFFHFFGAVRVLWFFLWKLLSLDVLSGC